MYQIKQHTFDSASHLQDFPEQEPDMGEPVSANYLRAVGMYKDLPFLSYRAGLATVESEITDRYKSISFNESLCYVNSICQQLKRLGIQKEDRVIIYAKNSPLWLLTDYAVQFTQGVMSPLYDTLNVDNIKYCINLLEAKYIYVTSETAPTIIGLIDQVPSLEYIIFLDKIVETVQIATQASKVALHFSSDYDIIDDTKSLWSLSSAPTTEPPASPDSQIDIQAAINFIKTRKATLEGRCVEILEVALPAELSAAAVEAARAELVVPSDQKCTDISAVYFTSGTSGNPKGAILTHTNVYSGGMCLGYKYVPYHLNNQGEESSTLSYLPLAHVFEHGLEHYVAIHGYNIYYSCGILKNISKDFALAKPCIILGVPRVFQKMYETFNKQLSKQSVIVKAIYYLSYYLKDLYFKLNPSAYATGKCALLDQLVFHKFAESLGGKMEMIVSGSSILPKNVYDFLRINSCAKVTNGYALTEISCSGTYNYVGQHYHAPSQMGYCSYLTEGKLVKCEDCEYDFEREKVGEICMKSPGVIVGYIDQKWGKVTPVADKDGYYHTGDLGEMNKDGTCNFIRRISQVIKLSQGEFVDLCKIEDVIESSPLVITAFVHAEADKSSPVCVLSVDSKACEGKFGKLTDEELKVAMVKEVDKLIRKSGMKGFNVPKAAHIVKDADWTTDRELFTPSQKKMARGFRARFAGELKSLFKEFDNSDAKNDSSKARTLISVAVCIIACVIICLK